MKKYLMPLIIIVVALAGIGLISYPYISNWINVRSQSTAIQDFAVSVKDLEAEQIAAELAAAREYNASLTTIKLVNDPFTGEREEGEDEYYFSQLDLTSMMGYVEIPHLNIKIPMYHGTSEAVLSKALGHLQGTSLPVGGEGTHSVITGHRGLPSAKLFTDLDQMEPGDLFYVIVLGEVLGYQVDDIQVIEPNDTELIQIIPGEDHVTLMTCTPYGINSHRLLIRGTRVELTAEEAEIIVAAAADSGPWLTNELVLIIGAAAAVIILVLLGTQLHSRRRLKKSKEWIYKDD